MTEERSCLNCGCYNADRCERYDGCCFHHSKWQPISRPKVQMTEEEARKLFIDIGISAIIGRAMEAATEHGYIRKSELVELVEEAEGICKRTDVTYEQIISKLRDALQALKKDHPEFGGKK